MEEIGPPFFILFLNREKEEKKFKLGGCLGWYKRASRRKGKKGKKRKRGEENGEKRRRRRRRRSKRKRRKE